MTEDQRIVGVDESGKGDFFGPLVVAAFLAPDSDVARLKALGVRDGKTLSDKRVLEIDSTLRETCPHIVEIIPPELYNTRYREIRNLNRLLAAVHASAIDRLLEQHDADLVVVDQFGKTELVSEALASRGRQIRLEQRFRGEEIPQVAAASILARAAFIREMQALSDQYGLDIPKGAAPQVDKAGRALVRQYGAEVLSKVAKVHFKNYHRVVNPGFLKT